MRYAGEKREQLKRDVIAAVGDQGATKVALAEKFSLSVNQCTHLLQEMQEQGIIEREGKVYLAVKERKDQVGDQVGDQVEAVEVMADHIVNKLSSTPQAEDVLLILECLARCKGDRMSAVTRAMAIWSRLSGTNG